MAWKYIESTGKKKVSEADAREHFGIHDKGCPVVELDNGMLACWAAAPLATPQAYPELSHRPKAKDSGFRACL
jgi:hypothetical protein